MNRSLFVLRFFRFVAVFLTFILSTGCATNSKSNSGGADTESEDSKALEEALRDLEIENYTAASITLQRLAKKDPASEMDLVVLYNLGVAREGLGQCKEAEDVYRSVARISNKKFERIEALALYRLGFVFECQGQTQKSIIAFLDARKRRSQLPQDIADAELPARLAAGYASLGRRKEALGFFNEASSGLKRILAQNRGSKKHTAFLSRTLLAMGKISETSDPLIFVRMLTMQQPFLLQAAELSARTEAQKANRELIRAYDRLLDLGKSVNPNQARNFYIEGIKAARELSRMRLPDTQMSTERAFDKVSEVERTFQARLANLSPTLPKTEENLKREGLKREGRVKGAPAFPAEKASSSKASPKAKPKTP